MNNRGESSGSDGKNGIYDSHDSHSSHKSHQPAGFRCTVNAPARTRTLDPVIKSHLLYQLSYKGGQVCVGQTMAHQGPYVIHLGPCCKSKCTSHLPVRCRPILGPQMHFNLPKRNF